MSENYVCRDIEQKELRLLNGSRQPIVSLDYIAQSLPHSKNEIQTLSVACTDTCTGQQAESHHRRTLRVGANPIKMHPRTTPKPMLGL